MSAPTLLQLGISLGDEVAQTAVQLTASSAGFHDLNVLEAGLRQAREEVIVDLQLLPSPAAVDRECLRPREL